MNLCQALINYIVMCQLPSVQGNRCESPDHSSTVLSCSVLSSSPGLTRVLIDIHTAGKVPNGNMSCPQEDKSTDQIRESNHCRARFIQ